MSQRLLHRRKEAINFMIGQCLDASGSSSLRWAWNCGLRRLSSFELPICKDKINGRLLSDAEKEAIEAGITDKGFTRHSGRTDCLRGCLKCNAYKMQLIGLRTNPSCSQAHITQKRRFSSSLHTMILTQVKNAKLVHDV